MGIDRRHANARAGVDAGKNQRVRMNLGQQLTTASAGWVKAPVASTRAQFSGEGFRGPGETES
jgi:hypothetical protein